MYSIEKEQFERFPQQMMELAKMAEEMGYQVNWIDKWSGGLMEINGQYFGYGLIPKFPLNSGISRQLVRDKVYSYMLMEKNAIIVPDGDYFFRYDEKYYKQTKGKGIKEAKKYAVSLGYPVFIKPNRGALGRDCKLVLDESELIAGLEKIWVSDFMAIVQRVLNGREYRVMFLDGEVILVYEKSKPKGGDVANLSGGGFVVGICDDVSDELKILVKKISDVFGLRYGGIDFIGEDINDVDKLTVLEINADPGLEGFLDFDREKGVEVLRKLLGASLSIKKEFFR